MQYITKEQIIWAYRIILGREPESNGLVFGDRSQYNSLDTLSAELFTSIEGMLKWQKNKFSNILAVFLHIPKTSGTSFLSLLRNNYAADFLLYFYAQNYNENYDGKILSSHCKFEYFTNLSRTLLFFSVVRDPIARAISTYKYIPLWNAAARENNIPLNSTFIYPKSMRLSMLYGSLSNEVLDNPQCRYLGGNTFEQVLEVWDKENFLVGCFDHQQEFANVCADLMHWHFRDFPHTNANPEENYQQRYLEEPGIVDLLIERNREDFKLYDYVKSKIVVNTINSEFDLTTLYPIQEGESSSHDIL